jgi:hypothetical protein
MRTEQILDSAMRAARDAMSPLGQELLLERMRSKGRGSQPIRLADIVRQHHRDACTAAAVRIAQIEGKAATDYADQLRERLRPLQAEGVQAYDDTQPGAGFSGNPRDPRWRAQLELDLTNQANDVATDLGLGVTGGVSVANQKDINITSYGDTNIAVDSPHARQSMNLTQTNTTTGLDAEAVRDLLTLYRDVLDRAPITIAQRADIDDDLRSIEDESNKPEPDQDRLKRLLTRAGTKLRGYGVQLANKVADLGLDDLTKAIHDAVTGS